jgi:hypothetical protein
MTLYVFPKGSFSRFEINMNLTYAILEEVRYSYFISPQIFLIYLGKGFSWFLNLIIIYF